MHISIPNSEELLDGSKPYVSYNIHINGTYHCSARFSVLQKLHERLKKQFGQGCLEQFPAKSMMSMIIKHKPDNVHTRRIQLQRWMQKIGGQKIIVEGETFQTFLLNAQKEVQKGPEEDVQLEIFLVNGKSVKVDIVSTDQTDDVLETAATVIGLAPELTYYFGLYMVEDVTGKVTIRKLQDFESPYVSLSRAPEGHKIMLRKAYWDTSLDEPLHEDPIALNLLYIETIADIKKGIIEVEDDVADDLANYRAQKDRRAFLNIASGLQGYGNSQFGKALCNFPTKDCVVTCALGSAKLLLQTEGEGGTTHEFQGQRMRCRRTATLDDGPEVDGKKATVEMEFEYYFDPEDGSKEGKMGWVSLRSSQTIHIAMCLQFLVEEMLRIKRGKNLRTPADRVGSFKPRRQKAGSKVNMDFLTSDASAGEGASTQSAMAGILGSGGPRVSVKLSELQARVKASEREDAKTDVPIDLSGIGAGEEEEDPDDYKEDDDDRNAFASIAGF